MHAKSTPRAFTLGDGSLVLRTALKILDQWKATTQQVCSILRITRSRVCRIRQGKAVRVDRDQLERASIVLNCHASLRLTFESPPRCQDSCRLIGFIKTINRGRKEPCNAALFT